MSDILEGQPKLFAAYAKAQSEFKTPELNRTAEIKKEGKLLYVTHYADLQECISCVKSLYKNGLSFVQTIKKLPDGWFLVLELMHESGETKESILPLNVNQTNQALGGTLTYLKRYQLSAFFGLAADFDDDGNTDTGNEVKFTPKAKPKPPPPPPKEEKYNPETYFQQDESLTDQEPEEHFNSPNLTLKEKLLVLKHKLSYSNEQMSEAVTRVTGFKSTAECSDEDLLKVVNYLLLKLK